jgi:hypothetical protein
VESDATGTSSLREEALALALARCHDTLAATLALLGTEQTAGTLTAAQAAAQARAAQAVYERDCGLARITAETGWQTWTGVGGILYARLPKSSPPRIVHAPSTRALREAIESRS